MRAPPPVEHASTLTLGWRVVLSLLVGASVASLLAWACPRSPWERLADPVVGAVVGLALGALAGLIVGWRWKSGPRSERTLRWDGQGWRLVSGNLGQFEQSGHVSLMLDLGAWMLVRFLPHPGMGAVSWLPLTASGDAARWAALRGALWNWRSQEAAR